MLIDTHCHLHDPKFFSPDEAIAVLQRATYQNVTKIIVIGTSLQDSLTARDFAITHNSVYWTFGIHPNEWQTWSSTEFNRVQPFSSLMPIAIGEVGLDYHYGEQNRKTQIKLFNEMLELATKHQLPVSFHVREAFDDFFPIINNFPHLKGVVHSFSDNKKILKRILTETDFYIGINGMATYSTLPLPPLEKILLETDAPFLTPKPLRGTKNEPTFIPHIANWLANSLHTNFETIAQATTANAQQLFHF